MARPDDEAKKRGREVGQAISLLSAEVCAVRHTGLGLAIVKEVSRLLGFTVRIHSTVGSGTQARVRIPNQ